MIYKYIALDKNSKKVSGTVESTSIEAVKTSLVNKGLKPITVKQSGSAFSDLMSGQSSKVKPKDLMIFTRQLATMINAGVPLVRSINTLQQQTESPGLNKTMSVVAKDVESGMAFADALEKHPKAFSPIYINMIRAGEAGGILDDILSKLAIQQEKDNHIRAKFKSAMTYPIILLSITLLTFVGLMVVIMPKMAKLIKDVAGPDASLPPLTQIMIAISNFMVTKWFIILPIVIVLVVVTKRYISTPKGRRKKDQILMKIPIIKEIIKKVAIARFARIFASLMSAGVNVVDSLNITAKAIGNAVIEDELTAAGKAVVNGQQLSTPLSESKILPPIVSQMIAVGEETGETDTILLKVADFYEEEVDIVVDNLSSILEPLMIVIMGSMVGLIAASVIGPIGNLSKQI